MEVQSPDGDIAFAFPSQARIEPWSPAQKMACRSQNGKRGRASTAADPDAQVSGYKGASHLRSNEHHGFGVIGILEVTKVVLYLLAAMLLLRILRDLM